MNFLSRNKIGKGNRRFIIIVIIIRGLVLKEFIMIRQIQELVDEKIIRGNNILRIKTELRA